MGCSWYMQHGTCRGFWRKGNDLECVRNRSSWHNHAVGLILLQIEINSTKTKRGYGCSRSKLVFLERTGKKTRLSDKVLWSWLVYSGTHLKPHWQLYYHMLSKTIVKKTPPLHVVHCIFRTKTIPAANLHLSSPTSTCCRCFHVIYVHSYAVEENFLLHVCMLE